MLDVLWNWVLSCIGTTEGEGALLGVQMGTVDAWGMEAGARVRGIIVRALERGSQLAKTLNPVWGHRNPPSEEDAPLLQDHSALLTHHLHQDREVWLAMRIDDHSSIGFSGDLRVIVVISVF